MDAEIENLTDEELDDIIENDMDDIIDFIVDELEELDDLTADTIQHSDDELTHYGVIGMKWGKRKARAAVTTSMKKAANKKFQDGLADLNKKGKGNDVKAVTKLQLQLAKDLGNVKKLKKLNKLEDKNEKLTKAKASADKKVRNLKTNTAINVAVGTRSAAKKAVKSMGSNHTSDDLVRAGVSLVASLGSTAITALVTKNKPAKIQKKINANKKMIAVLKKELGTTKK